MMLAQAATINGGMLSLLGAGWLVRAPEPAGPASVAVMLSVPRDQEGHHDIAVRLLDSDGDQVTVDGNEIAIEGELVVKGLVGVAPELPLLAPFVATVGPFPLEPGRAYRWQVYVDGATQDRWSVGFRTTPP